MKYFLAKTEPADYSIDDLDKDKVTQWDGVTNPLAVRYLKSMQKGDKVLIYHSGKNPHIAGLAEVSGNSGPDPENSKSWLVEFKFLSKFKDPVTLLEIKASHQFNDSKLVRQGRLSAMEVPIELIEWLKTQDVMD